MRANNEAKTPGPLGKKHLTTRDSLPGRKVEILRPSWSDGTQDDGQTAWRLDWTEEVMPGQKN